jgi:hypothetical protein
MIDAARRAAGNFFRVNLSGDLTYRNSLNLYA